MYLKNPIYSNSTTMEHQGGGEVKIEVEWGVITFSSICIENTTPNFYTEIVVVVLSWGNNHHLMKLSMSCHEPWLLPVFITEREGD